VQEDGVLLPEREVSSHNPFFHFVLPQAAQNEN
jgi:hypothetical protein